MRLTKENECFRYTELSRIYYYSPFQAMFQLLIRESIKWNYYNYKKYIFTCMNKKGIE